MRLVSIVGDSISTFEGYNPKGYSVYYDKETQILNQMDTVYDTWWAKVNQYLHAFLCVNNSYSGSKVSGKAFPAGESDKRLQNLRTSEYSPDYILIYLGLNDFGNGIQVSGTNYPNPYCGKSDSFLDAYNNMVKKIKAYYPDAKVVCGTLMRTKVKSRTDWIFPERFAGVPMEEYNAAIREAAQKNHIYLADTALAGETYETMDGTHPTAQGHAEIAHSWIRCLDSLGLTEPSIETCIKFYNANRKSDMCVNMVFQSLIKEKVLLPFYSDGSPAGIVLENKTVIPVFTSPNEFGADRSVLPRAVFLKDYIDLLCSINITLIVNPFSRADMQFIIPAAAIQKMLIPILKS